jgi:hypothetical protein
MNETAWGDNVDEFNDNSIQFNGHLLTCRLNITSAYYKASTRTKIQHKHITNIQKQNTKQSTQNITNIQKQNTKQSTQKHYKYTKTKH